MINSSVENKQRATALVAFTIEKQNRLKDKDLRTSKA